MREKYPMKENVLDITDEVALLSVSELILILQFCSKNGYEKIHFDGYDATITVIRS